MTQTLRAGIRVGIRSPMRRSRSSCQAGRRRRAATSRPNRSLTRR
jgi:hypothetical protein